MARLPEQRKILPEEFPDQKFMPRLLSPLNRFFGDVVRALNKGLTIRENFDGELITVIIDGTYPLDLPWNRFNPPKAAWIGQCKELNGNHTNFTDGLYLDWEFTAKGAFRINTVTGVTPTSANKYTLTIVVIAG